MITLTHQGFHGKTSYRLDEKHILDERKIDGVDQILIPSDIAIRFEKKICSIKACSCKCHPGVREYSQRGDYVGTWCEQ